MMGTRWRGLLAPINQSTDDGRRFLDLSNRELPLGLKWQRTDDSGHDNSVVVGSIDVMGFGTLAEAVDAGWISEDAAKVAIIDPTARGAWGAGELFDDVSAAEMPRLAEDVAEVMKLLTARVIAPSVDPIPVGRVFLAEPGLDEPVSDERFDELWDESMDSGVEIVLEWVFEEGMISAATLVVIPAFSEVRPFELLTADDMAALTAAGTAPAPADPALIRALTAAAQPAPPVPADVFADPAFAEYTDITVEHRDGEDFLRVAGHYAAEDACHLAFRTTCVQPPVSYAGYVPFHRYTIDTDTGPLATGRITTGFGKIGTGCRCPADRGKDDHACTLLSMADTIKHHDRLTVLAHVRAGEDEHGRYVVGVAPLSLTPADRRALSGRKFSGDWRDHGGNLELVELLALTVGEPAFTAPRVGLANGRQRSLVASFAPRTPTKATGGLITPDLDYVRLGRSIADAMLGQTAIAAANAARLAEAVTAAAEVHTGAMVALRMTDADATRLAVEGGEPADELHLTLAYLGEAADIPAETQTAILDGLTAKMAGPLDPDMDPDTVTDEGMVCEGFAVSVFNPEDTERDTAIVLGVSGGGLELAHRGTLDVLQQVMDDAGLTMPEQQSPYNAHVTLIYSDDLTLVEQLADRTGQPVTFDRLRVAFAGVVTDIPIGGTPPAADSASSAVTEVSALEAEILAALDRVDGDRRAREAASLLKDMEAVGV